MEQPSYSRYENRVLSYAWLVVHGKLPFEAQRVVHGGNVQQRWGEARAEQGRRHLPHPDPRRVRQKHGQKHVQLLLQGPGFFFVVVFFEVTTQARRGCVCVCCARERVRARVRQKKYAGETLLECYLLHCPEA